MIVDPDQERSERVSPSLLSLGSIYERGRSRRDAASKDLRVGEEEEHVEERA